MNAFTNSSTAKAKSAKKQTRKSGKLTVKKQSCGVDIGKDEFVACYRVILSDGTTVKRGQKKFKNTAKGVKAFNAWLNKLIKKVPELVCPIVLEATGVYYENLAHYLFQQDCKVHVLLPNQTKAYSKSLNVKTKTDKVDAATLALMGLERTNLRVWKPASPIMRELQKLSRQRASLVVERTRIQNRRSAEKCSYQPNPIILQQLDSLIKHLTKAIKDLEKSLKQIVEEEDPVLLKKIENITALKGISFITVITVIAETNGFELFRSIKQLISYAGYDVVQNESGSFVGKTRISKKGNKHIRRALHMPSLSVVRHNPDSPFEQLYQRVFDRTKIKYKGYVAVQRKMLCIIYTLFKNNEMYDANFHKKDCTETNKKLAVS